MRDKTVNVAIFGSGLAGLTAAVTLLEKGVTGVAIFEKRPFQGGAVSNTPMCVMAVKNDPKYQDRAFRAHCEFTNYNSNMAVARKWINNSWRVIPFIQNLGLDFAGVVETPLDEIGVKNGYTGGFPKGMNLGDYYLLKARGKGHGAALICLRAAGKVRQLGGELVTNTRLVELIENGGKVTGALVKEKNGEVYRVNARAVIIATGGVSDDKELVMEMSGYTVTDRECSQNGNMYFNHFVNGGMDGDGHRAIWGIGGAKMPGMGVGRLMAYPGVVNYVPWQTRNQMHTILEQPYLVVNKEGKRFINEEENQVSFNMAAAMKNQPGCVAYLIFDEDTMTRLEEHGTEYFYMIFQAVKIINGREQFREMIEVQMNKHVFVCDSIEALANQTGINKQQLLKTVCRYNHLCDKGHDDDFAKNPQYMRPVRHGKYYAIEMCNCTYNIIGGIRINEDCAVLKTDGRPIEGLYAAGDLAAGDVFGYPMPNVCATSTVAYTQGMICADVLAEVLKEDTAK